MMSLLHRLPSTASYNEYDGDDLPRIPDEVELGPIITALKLGTSMTRFSSRKKSGKADQKTFQLNLEEFKISWFRAGTGREEGKSKCIIYLFILGFTHDNMTWSQHMNVVWPEMYYFSATLFLQTTSFYDELHLIVDVV